MRERLTRGRGETAAAGAVVILCATTEGPDRFQRIARAALSGRPDRRLVTISVDPDGWDWAAVSALLAQQPTNRVICLGFGAAGAAALHLAEALDAAALAVAPDLAADGHNAGAPARLVVRLTAGPGAPALVRSLQTGLIPATLVGALDQCAWLDPLLSALSGNGPLPAIEQLRETWLARFAYQIEVDCRQATFDTRNTLHLEGTVLHQGTEPLGLLADPFAPVRIGARVLDAQGLAVPGLEGRCAFPGLLFNPGQKMPFQITLPRFDPALGDAQIMVSLVCDGAFWFSDAGFAAAYLAAERPGPAMAVPLVALEAPASHTRVEAHGLTFPIPEAAETDPIQAVPEAFTSPALPYFLDDCRPGAVVLDVGAGFGAFCLPAARRVGPEGTVYAIDASPDACGLLSRTIALNALGNVQVLPLGASDTLSHTGMRREAPDGSDREPDRILKEGQSLLPVLPLDLLRPRLRRIDILRLGMTSTTCRVVRGALEILRADRPRVFLRYAPDRQRQRCGISGASLLTQFRDLGYRFEILRPGQGRERVCGANPVAAVDRAWEAYNQAHGHPLDLCLHPVDPEGSAQ